MTIEYPFVRLYQLQSCKDRDEWPVPMTPRFHLFPFRTQKLSLVVPKILGWRRPGKIGRCRLTHFFIVCNTCPKVNSHKPQFALCLAVFCSKLLSAQQCNNVFSQRFCLSWPVGQAVKTTASHAVIMGSIPVGVTNLICTFSSVGRATDS